MKSICLRPGFGHEVFRSWQSERPLNTNMLVYPLFVSGSRNEREEIESMPGQYRLGLDRLEQAIEAAVANGLRSVLLFGSGISRKDSRGSKADSKDAIVPEAIRILRTNYPQLVVIADVCLCAYTDHGHCGILKDDGAVDNEATLRRLAEIACAYAEAGAHIVAPSDMMDNRIAAIRDAMTSAGAHDTAIMSYAAKFATCLYGPFREAAGSTPLFGDRQSYQLPIRSRRLAMRAIERDVEQGADFVTIKPAGPCLDLVLEARSRVRTPLACYQVSGEYAMLQHAARAGVFNLKTAVLESFDAMLRAGADILITYFAPQVLEWKNGESS